jgi:hypothetical protein
MASMSIALLLIAATLPSQADSPLAGLSVRDSAWIENLGQWDTPARFVGEIGDTLVRIEPGVLWLQRGGTVQDARTVLLKLTFEGASAAVSVEGISPTPTLHSYFIGNEPEKWVHAARAYTQVKLSGIYPGIDVIVGEHGGALKYDIVAAPGADLSRIVMRCEGADALCLDAEGAIRVEARDQVLVHSMGETWEERVDGSRRHVSPRWRILDRERLGILLDDHDPTARLVVDPELAWATYLGTTGNWDSARVVEYAPDGSAIVAGTSSDQTFPTTPGSVVLAPSGEDNIFVSRIAPDGGSLLYSCIIGGSIGAVGGHEASWCIDVDQLGRAYVAGETTAPDFPTTPGAFDRVFGGNSESFVFRLSPNGDALEYSTFLGGSQGDRLAACAVAPTGAIVATGHTASPDYPTTPGAMQQTLFGQDLDGVVTRLNPDGSAVEWSTYLGGDRVDQAWGIALADNDDVLLTGSTHSTNFPTTPGTLESIWQGSTFDGKAFVTRMRTDGMGLVWSTFLGGPAYNGSFGTQGNSIAVLPSGDVFVAGTTGEPSFPTTPSSLAPVYHFNPQLGMQDEGFVSRFRADGSGFVYSTFVGTEHGDGAIGIKVDASGVATVAVQCWTMPVTPGCYQSQPAGGGIEMGVCRIEPDGSRLIYATLIGGPAFENVTGFAMDGDGRVVLAGYTNGGFPVTPGSFDPTYNGGQLDGVVVSLDLIPTGVTLVGASTPACHGELMLQTNQMPQAGDGSFALLCSNAPPNAPGWLLLGRKPLAQPVIFAGSALWVSAPNRWTRFPVVSDGNGYVAAPISLANVAAGSRLAAQMIFRNTPGCPGQGPTSASNAVAIDVQ